MPDDNGEQVTLILPSGQKQAFLIPSGMSDNEAKLYVRSKRPDLFQAPTGPATSMGPAKSSFSPLDPAYYGEKIANFLQKSQSLTQEGKAENPTQNVLGKATGLAFGGNQGIGQNQEGILTNPVTSSLIPGAQGEPALAGALRGVAQLTKLNKFAQWLTSSKSVGAQALEAASAKVGNAAVELSPRTNEIVDEIVQQGKSGGSVPKVVTDLLDRLGPSTRQAAEASPGPLTYNEARLFQGNMSSLSVAEQQSLKGRMGGLVKQLANSFGQDVQAAADAGGAGPEHAIGMQEYAAASSRNRALSKVGKVVPYIGGAGYGAHLIQDFLKKK